MSDIVSKISEMEEDNAPVAQDMFCSQATFDLYFCAALTGVIAHYESDKHSDEELVEQARNLAAEAVKLRGRR